MTKFIRYKHPEGHVAECHPVPNARLVKVGDDIVPLLTIVRTIGAPLPDGVTFAESEDQFVARIAAKDTPKGATNIQIVEAP